MYEFVGKRQICDGIDILTSVIIVVIAAERLSESMTVIEHRGDTVETESVEAELLQPILAVGEQEVDHIILAIVKAERIPCRMLAAAVAVEVLVVASVETSESLHFIFHGVTVDYIHDHGNTQLMGTVDKALQILGSAETARRSIETRHMIAERTIVRVLLDSHDLDGVVAVLGDARENEVTEFGICAYPLLLLGHTDMALIYEQRACVGAETLHLPFVRLGRPHLGGEHMGVLVLHHARGIGRDTFTAATVPVHDHLV